MTIDKTSSRRAFLIGAAPALIAAPALALPQPLSPQERIDAAMAEIRAVLAEAYPGHFVTETQMLRRGTGGLAIGAYPLEGYQTRFHFHADGPLRAADVEGRQWGIGR
ncbi:hypothetical protein [Ancylobacter polymorphus]|uniref:Twin-arginine translocation pathway signal n=1 Tax=Ancylobacter polymorphus TaxID=223390 RepID=A0A9E6ZUG5_9HYPH|nr:hypothetical protein [Ancylobacter polymorphus]UOK70277.1 hypothetical protein K9D25_16295 [Ancylobacter polymorphus]